MANKAIVSGHIRFGIVTIPIKLYTAQDPQDIQLHKIHKGCGSPIKYRNFCPVHNMIVTDIVRAYEAVKPSKGQKGLYVELTDAETEGETAEDGRPIEVVRFTTMEDLDPVHFEKTYWVAPDEVGRIPFALLRDAMEKEHKVALGTFILKTKQHPVLLRPYKGVLAMEILLRADEVRDPSDLAVTEKPDAALVQATRQLIQAMTGPTNLEEFADGRRERILAVVKAKMEGGAVPAQAPVRKPEPVANLMEALKASMEMATKKQKKVAAKK